jgi:hypothetical protein
MRRNPALGAFDILSRYILLVILDVFSATYDILYFRLRPTSRTTVYLCFPLGTDQEKDRMLLLVQLLPGTFRKMFVNAWMVFDTSGVSRGTKKPEVWIPFCC